VRVYRDMVLIREFETMLNSIKTQGSYQGSPTITSARLTSP